MKGIKQKLVRYAPWLTVVVVAVLSFVAGSYAGGDRTSADGGHAHEQTADGTSDDDGTVWTCSMHPNVRQNEPGKCPICGMDLVPASREPGAPREPNQITLSERAKTLARIRTSPVRHGGSAGVERHLLGRIEPDETALRTVTAWSGGRIDRLHVAATGQRVRKGQVIATLYSPEVYSAHQDLLAAVAHRERLADGSTSGKRTAETALKAARQRLKLLGVPAAELSRMEKADAPWRQVPIRTPFGGTVIERIATEGSYVETGSGLYRLAELSRLWVQLDAYESDLPLLEEGQGVDVEVEALPGETLEGEVAFIDPVIDPETRTARVRIEIPNPDGKLRPGMFAEAVVRGERGEHATSHLVIPKTAPLFTGRRSVVYVEVPGAERPTYELRVVKLGPKSRGTYPVLAGLSAGERVVTHGAFVLDADLQIRGGVSMMSLPDDTEVGPYDGIVRVSPERKAELAKVIEAYLDMQSALATNDRQQAEQASARLDEARAGVGRMEQDHARAQWLALKKDLAATASRIDEADSLERIRHGFHQYSESIERLLRSFGNPLDDTLHIAHCPMAFGQGEGANWVQRGKAIDNSYLGEGSGMRDCGSIESSVAPGTYLRDRTLPAAPAAGGGHQH